MYNMKIFEPNSKSVVQHLKSTLLTSSMKYHFNSTTFVEKYPIAASYDYAMSTSQTISILSDDVTSDVSIITVPTDLRAQMIFELVLEAGVATTSLETKLRMTSFPGVDSFCGNSSIGNECKPGYWL